MANVMLLIIVDSSFRDRDLDKGICPATLKSSGHDCALGATDDAAPVLPKGTIIKLTAWHDNTAANRANPDPTQWVGWGQRSFDDMYHAHVNVVYLTDEDYEQIVEERRRTRASEN